MNFPGPINSSHLSSASAVSLDSEHFNFTAHSHPGSNHGPAGGIIVPDKHLLFEGHYARDGNDLVLSAQDQKYVVHDYFKGEKRPSLLSDDGAMLSGHIVSSLTGYVQYAQAAPADAAAQVIGHVMKLTGSASVIRNGVTVELNIGDAVQKGDVVQTGSDSSIALTLIDGSAFGMTANARMVLSEMVYDPNGSSNSAFISLVQGTITFVAGQTAKNGNMRVETPVATMGIRGTAVLAKIDAVIGTVEVSLGVEPNPNDPSGPGHVGSLVFYDNNTGALVGTMSRSGTFTLFSPGGVGQPVNVTEYQKTVEQLLSDKNLFNQVFQLYFPNFNPDANPKSTDQHGSTITPPPTLTGLTGTDPTSGRPTITYTIQVTNPDTHVTTDLKITFVNTPPIFSVTNATDVQATVLGSHQFKLGDHVTIIDPDIGVAPFLDVAVPYVANSGSIMQATTTSPAPASYLLNSNLVSLDSVTGVVTYNPEGFRFLGDGEKAVYTFQFISASGVGGSASDRGTETLTLTITGENDSPVFAATDTPIAFSETQDTKNDATRHVIAATLAFTDEDFSDTANVFSLSKTVATQHAATHTTADLSKLPSNATLLGYLTIDNSADSSVGVTRVPLTDQGTVTAKFSAPDNVFDFLAEGEQVQIVYTITLDDGHAGSMPTTETITFTVTGTNDAPVLTADTGTHSLTETTDATLVSGVLTLAVNGSLAFSDVDLTDTHSTTSPTAVTSAVWEKPDHTSGGTIPTATLTALATALTTSLASDTTDGTGGQLNWSFKLPDGLADFLAKDETLTIQYTVAVSDGHTDIGTATQPITIVITGTNDGPVAVADNVQGIIVEAGNNPDDTIFAGTPQTTGNVLTNDTDVDINDTHTVVGVAAGNTTPVLNVGVGATIHGTYGDLVLNIHGDWTYTLDNSRPATNALAQDVHVDDVFSYTESDNNNATSTTTLTIGITGTNDAPVTNNAPVAATDLNTGPAITEQGVSPGNTSFAGVSSATGNVLANDTDVDSGDTQTVQGIAAGTSATPLTGHVGTVVVGMYGSVTIDSHGNWAYTLDNTNANTNALKQGEAAQDVFTYTMHDTAGATSSATLTIDITGTNDAPVISSNAAAALGSATEDTTLTATGQLTATDVDHGATQSWSVQGPDTGAYGSIAVDSSTGQWTYTLANGTDGTASAVQSLAAGEHHDESFTIIVTDDQGATAPQTVTVTVNGTNDAPVIDTTTLAAVNEDTLSPAGATVAALFTGKFHDIDNGSSFKGIAVIANNATADQGAWQYNTGNGWEDIGSPTADHALIFSTDTQLRFVPAADYNGTPGSLSVLGIDDTYDDAFTTGTLQPGGQYTYDTTDHGGSTPFSAAAVDIATSIISVNDAPVAVADTISNDTPPSDSGWVLNTDNGHYYRYVSGGYASWTDAQTAASSDGGYLATVTNSQESTFVNNLIGSHSGGGTWLGGYGPVAADASSWYWTNGPEQGTHLTFTNWDTSEPNGFPGFTDAGLNINPDGSWNDVPTSFNDHFGGFGYVEEWGGQAGQVVFREDTGTTLTTQQLLANDTDIDTPHASLSITGVSASSANGGSVSLDGNIITYHPAANYNGPDSFTYTLSDGSLTSTGSVTFNVTAVNDAPVVDLDSSNAATVATGYSALLANDGNAFPIASSPAITDVDNTTMVSAVVVLTNGASGDFFFVPGETSAGSNSGTLASGIAWSISGTAGDSLNPLTITFSGTYSSADYADAIQQISFGTTGATGDRHIDVTVNDGVDNSNIARATISVEQSSTVQLAVAENATAAAGVDTSLETLWTNLHNGDFDSASSTNITLSLNGQTFVIEGENLTFVQNGNVHVVTGGTVTGLHVSDSSIPASPVPLFDATGYNIDAVAFYNSVVTASDSTDFSNLLGNYNYQTTGGTGPDKLFGGSLADVIDTGGSADIVNAGAGNDVIVIHDNSSWQIDGGTGINTLQLAGAFDMVGDSPGQLLNNIEIVDLNKTDANKINVDPQGIYEVNDAHTVRVLGNGQDVINLKNDFEGHPDGHWAAPVTGVSYTGDSLTQGVVFDRYDYVDGANTVASLYVEHDAGDGIVVNHAPVFDTDSFTMSQVGNTTTIGGVTVSDVDSSLADSYTASAVAGSGATLTPAGGSGHLTDINDALATGVTYDPGSTPPVSDTVTLSVSDGFGAHDTVNFIFNQSGTGPVTLTGTDGKDVIFSTGYADTMTGGAGRDQFVFTTNTDSSLVTDTITDFQQGQDKIDLHLISGFGNTALTQLLASADHPGSDTLLHLSANNDILVKNVAALTANDFIIHSGTFGS